MQEKKIEISYSGALLNKRLEQLMSMHQISLSQLARAIDSTPTTLARLKDNPNANPTAEILTKLSIYFDITLDQLLGLESLPRPLIDNECKIPILSWEEAINPEKFISDEKESIYTNNTYEKNAFALIIKDPDNPIMQVGTALVILLNKEIRNKSLVLALRNNEKTPRLFRGLIIDGDPYLASLDPRGKTQELSKAYSIIGRVAEVIMPKN